VAIKRDQLKDRVLQATRERLMKTAPLGKFCEVRTRAVNERTIAQ
jgi:hypothetical protein